MSVCQNLLGRNVTELTTCPFTYVQLGVLQLQTVVFALLKHQASQVKKKNEKKKFSSSLKLARVN